MANTQNQRKKNTNNTEEVTFELMEHIDVLEERKDGWTKEVNIVAWNGGPGKIDIRDWDPDHERMSKGITLFEEEAETLARALARRYGLRYINDPPAREERHEPKEEEPVHAERPDILFDEPEEADATEAAEPPAEGIPFEETAAGAMLTDGQQDDRLN